MCRPLAGDAVLEDRPPSRTSPECPFAIRQLDQSSYLIRENDSFGEHPHIYAKIFIQPDGQGVIVLSDTGVGTNTSKRNIWTLLESAINPGSKLPYLVILSHCHYDHILGLGQLPSNVDVSVVASSYAPSFITPYSKLQQHSLCDFYSLAAPRYEISIWAHDQERLSFRDLDLDLDIRLLHTPGHTPDSLSWYHSKSRTLFVGDSFYQQTSYDTRTAPWGEEKSAPIIFTPEGNIFDWWGSLKTLIAFVEHENETADTERPLVRLGAGHVTASAEAYGFLLRVRAFAGRVMRDEIHSERMPDRQGLQVRHWKEDKDDRTAEFSLVAPLKLVDDARRQIPKDEWQ
ncbi:uncharacterized protein HMPREF1541_02215 [Cyphellophora europaea CBS 101466]|uniref:Metallo-beta-lactamase domain-containing protein n=1 Tax=Cyphellophora europaea (strain CBS 101466) TaxID=1220924 RepID=W2S2Y9_CYPE1|nr:uncharacterized protein HMPREF1541_02215 [Cyphellophora europaea CBS 101466]ETN43057.1 hypothetical protein HMPREF1541_02215 [Cyphellophora europaea CBS 101466]